MSNIPLTEEIFEVLTIIEKQEECSIKRHKILTSKIEQLLNMQLQLIEFLQKFGFPSSDTKID
jgi:hypothetical protein